MTDRSIFVDGYYAASVGLKHESNPYHMTYNYDSFYDWLEGFDAFLIETGKYVE